MDPATLPLALPATRVVVMEDRAQVEHRGALPLLGGTQTIPLAGLPPVIVDRSLKVDVAGADLLDARVHRRWKAIPRGGLSPDASELRRRVAELEQEQRMILDHVALLRAKAQLLAIARTDLLRAIAEQTGHGQTPVAAWREALASLTARQGENDQALRAANQEQNRVETTLEKSQALLNQAEPAENTLETLLELTVRGGEPGTARVTFSYLVPCALWRPTYRATLRDDRVHVEAEAMVWQNTGQDWNDVALFFSTARPTLGTLPPALLEDRIALRPKSAQEKRVVQVSLREQAIPTGGNALDDLPGLDDGGQPRLLAGPARARVPSDGQPHRLFLGSFASPAESEWQCPAELTPRVFRVARFRCAAEHVLLAGPVDLVRDSGYVGRSTLPFTSPGEAMKLCFGPEDGLRVVRALEEKHEEARLTGRRTVTKTITWSISNARPVAARLVVEERLPVSEVKEVEIEVLDKQCDPPAPAPSAEGIVRCPFDLPPHGTCQGTFAWRLTAASSVSGV